MQYRSSRSSILLGLAGWIFLCPAGAMAATIIVPVGGSIAGALDGALPGDTVILECGTYSEQNLTMPEGVTLRSESGTADCVTIMTDGSAPALVCTGSTSATQVAGITFTIDSSVIDPAVQRGGGVYCTSAAPVFRDCRFEQLTATYGGAVYCTVGSRPTFETCVFRDNNARAVGGALACVEASRPRLTGCLVAGNTAGAAGGAFNAVNSSHIGLDHCTIADNIAENMGEFNMALSFWNASDDTLAGTIIAEPALWVGDAGSILRADCSNIYSGGGDVPVDPNYGSFISADPMFCTDLAGDHYFDLNAASPCTPDAAPACGGMGALPVGCGLTPVDDSLQNGALPLVTRLQETYPNPFNPRTTIKYDVSKPGHVTVAVFDLAGRLVNRLVDEPLSAGHHQVVWQGDASDGRPLSAGVYFVRLKTAEAIDTRRMTLIK